jgi:hypothetical protein
MNPTVMNATTTNEPSRHNQLLRWLVVTAVLLFAVGATLILVLRNRQADRYSLGDGGSFAVKRDANGRVTELVLFYGNGQPKLRANVEYFAGHDAIHQFLIYDPTGELVTVDVSLENGGHAATPGPAVEKVPFKISGAFGNGKQSWNCDGQLLFEERRTITSYEIVGPNEISLFRKDL